MVVDGFGCEINMGQWVAKSAWVQWLQDWCGSAGVVLVVDEGFWPWVIGVVGFQRCGDGDGFYMIGLWFF